MCFEKTLTPLPIHANVLLTSLPIHDKDIATNYKHNNISSTPTSSLNIVDDLGTTYENILKS
jgi:hypothetical protein